MNDQEFRAWLYGAVTRLEDKVDHNSGILAGQARDISHHIARTDALQERVEQVANEVKPLADWQSRAKGIAWFIGIVVAAVGVYATVGALVK